MNARRRNEYTFRIPFDRSTNEYGQAEIRTRLVRISGERSTGALSEDAISLTESSGVLDLKSRIDGDEIVITTRVRDEALRRREYHDGDILKVLLDIRLPETDEAPCETLSAHFWVSFEAAPADEPGLAIKAPGMKTPIPADSRKPATITFQLLKGGDGEPATGREASWEKDGESWKSIITPLCGISDGVNGTITFSYTPPDLFYTPESPFSEKITVYSGTNGKKKEIGSFELVLAPRVFCLVEAEKQGLVFPPVELRLEPDEGRCIRTISGTAHLPVEDPETGRAMQLPVSGALITVHFWNGEKYDGMTVQAESDEEGVFRVELPGLHFLSDERGKDCRIVHEGGESLQASLDSREETALSACEESLTGLIGAYNLPEGLNDCRIRHSRLISAGKPDRAERQGDALKLLQSTLDCAMIFEEMGRERRGRLRSAMERTLTVICETADLLGAIPEAIAKDGPSIISGITGAGLRSGSQAYLRRLIQSMLSPDLRKATEELHQCFTGICGPAHLSFTPLAESGAQAFHQGLLEIDRLALLIPPSEGSKGDRIPAEQIECVCAILEKTAAIIGSCLPAVFVAAFQRALSSFSCPDERHPVSLMPIRDAIRSIVGLEEDISPAGGIMKRAFLHMVEVSCGRIGEMLTECLSGRASDSGNLIRKAVDSLDWPGTLTGRIIARTLEEMGDLTFRLNPAGLEQRRSGLTAELESFTGAQIEYPAEMDYSLECMSSLIFYLDRYVTILQSLCAFMDAPSLAGLTGRLDLLGQTFKSCFRTFPDITADAADSLHVSLIFSASALNSGQGEDA